MKKKLLSFAIIFILASCSFPPVQEVRFITKTYEPTDHVEVLYSWPHDRNYIKISELEVSAGDHAEDSLIDKAKEIGADAIVIGAPHRHSQVYVPINGKIISDRAVAFESIRAIAIKYKPWPPSIE